MPPDSAKGIPHCVFPLAVTIMIHLFSDRPLVGPPLNLALDEPAVERLAELLSRWAIGGLTQSA